MKTGKLRWHYQLVHHDVWEGDIATPLLLYDAQAGGHTQKSVGIMRADGYLFLLNRETGQAHFSGRRAARAPGCADGNITHATLSSECG